MVQLETINKAGHKTVSKALKLSDTLIKTERIRLATMKLLAKMASANAKDLTACAKIVMNLSCSDRDAVVAAGALPSLVGLLRPKGTKEDVASCAYAARAIWAITQGCEYQVAVVGAGAVGSLVHLLKDGSIHQRTLACRTLSRIIHNSTLSRSSRLSTQSVVAAGAAEQVVLLLHDTCEPLFDATDELRKKAAKAAASLLCCLACNASPAQCEILQAAGAADPLVKLLREGPDDARAYAAQALVDIAGVSTVRKPALQAILTPIFCQLLDSGSRMIGWFDVARGLGTLMWRSRHIEQRFADVVVRPLIGALVDPVGFTSTDAENCVVMGLGCIGSVPDCLVAVVE